MFPFGHEDIDLLRGHLRWKQLSNILKMGDANVTIAHEEEAITAVTSNNYSDIEENK